jgi:pyridoxamine 5'-phosphate oxidase
MVNNKTIENLRMNYMMAPFNENEAFEDPVKQFQLWFKQALDSDVPEPNAFTLASIDKSGNPNARVVLLKSIDTGFVFYTNYDSVKGKELDAHPFATCVFLWLELGRQVRIRGNVEKVSESMSEEYFNSRPVESRVGAIVSKQSEMLTSREVLEKEFAKWDAKPESEIKRPLNWGGYRVIPNEIEFWQGRESRLHDRIQYKLENGNWKKSRLYP